MKTIFYLAFLLATLIASLVQSPAQDPIKTSGVPESLSSTEKDINREMTKTSVQTKQIQLLEYENLEQTNDLTLMQIFFSTEENYQTVIKRSDKLWCRNQTIELQIQQQSPALSK